MVKVDQKTESNTKKQSQRPLGFGSIRPRFLRPVSHPKLDPSGLYVNRDAGCEPALYEPIPMSKVYEVNKNLSKHDVWKREAESQEWSQNLGYRNEAILSERRFRATCGGPAYLDIKELNTNFSTKQNIGFGTGPRSRTLKFVTPAPGTYYKSTPFKAPYGPHSNRQPFDFGKPAGFKVSSHGLAPNRYKIIDKDSIEMKSKKLVSLRGPYDLFTGPRENTNIKNHFGTNKRDYCPWWPMVFPGSFERLKKSHFGETSKQTGRDAPDRGRLTLMHLASANRCPKDPGPADTNDLNVTVFKQNKAPFLSSLEGRSGSKRAVIAPGIGRYNIEPRKRYIAGNGHKHVFLSKVQRGIGGYVPPPMNSF